MIAWLKKRTIGDWAFAIIALTALWLRGPMIIDHFQKQGASVTPVMIDGKLIPPPKEKSILVFWATWCGPCSVELKRINSAVAEGSITTKNLFAINMGEEQVVIDKAMKEHRYRFSALRDNGELARELGVTATPTIAFIDNKGKIEWLSAGLSPTLIYRISRFQKD